MKKFKLHKKLLTGFIVLILLSTFVSPTFTSARTVEDIQSEIDRKAKELEELNSSVESAQRNLDASTDAKNNASGKLKQLAAEISQIEDQIEFNQLKTKQLEEQLKLKELEMEIRDEKQDRQIKSAYLNWKSSDYITVFFGSEDYFKSATYYDSVANEEQQSIESLAAELGNLESEFDSFISEKEELEKQVEALNEQKKANEAEIAKINQLIANDSSKLSLAQNQASLTQSSLDMLQEEQKILVEAENRIIQQGGQGTNPIQNGEFYFEGYGNDNAQGHGVGLSQLGTLGAALAGWNYKQIVQFYFQGATVVKYTTRTQIPVAGYGDMEIEKYIAGLGEVPSNGCENLGVNFGELNFWACWPKEAIKAQLVTARAYALNFTRNGTPICTTAVCQVYWASEGKKDLALETEYEVVAFGGEPINALYSAQNNQGAGTANNETVWSDRAGVGYPKSYFRSVNDNGFYYPAAFGGCGNGDCARWRYRTNSYTLAEIQDMLEWSVTAPDQRITSGDRTFISAALNNIGTLQNITFERDTPVAGGGSSMGRARYVVLNGTNGSSKMAGWFFKALWNIWIYNVNPSGQQDLIYSKSYFFRSG